MRVRPAPTERAEAMAPTQRSARGVVGALRQHGRRVDVAIDRRRVAARRPRRAGCARTVCRGRARRRTRSTHRDHRSTTVRARRAWSPCRDWRADLSECSAGLRHARPTTNQAPAITASQPPSIAVARFRDTRSSRPPITVDDPGQHLQPSSRRRPVPGPGRRRSRSTGRRTEPPRPRVRAGSTGSRSPRRGCVACAGAHPGLRRRVIDCRSCRSSSVVQRYTHPEAAPNRRVRDGPVRRLPNVANASKVRLLSVACGGRGFAATDFG